MNYEHKYYKYKNKYLQSKSLVGGNPIRQTKNTSLQPPQRNKSIVSSEENLPRLRMCPIKWMINKETVLSKRLIEFQNQFVCPKNVDGLHMTMAFCNIDFNIYKLVKDEIENELSKLLKTGEFGGPVHIRERSYKAIGGFLVAVEYYTSPAIINIVTNIRKMVLDIVIKKCQELYTKDIPENEINNYVFIFDRKANEIIKIQVHNDKIKELPGLNFDATSVMFYINGKWKEIIQLRTDNFLPHISIVNDGKLKSGKECNNSDKLSIISLKPNCDKEFMYDDKDFVESLLLNPIK